MAKTRQPLPPATQAPTACLYPGWGGAQSSIGGRPQDSYGLGLSWVAANSDPAAFGFQASELILQAYAQVHVVGTTFLQPTISLLPRVGLPEAVAPSLSGSLQLTVLF